MNGALLAEENSPYCVSWVGLDQSYQEEDGFTLLLSAQKYAVSVSEHGGHTITLSDRDGQEYGF